MFPCDKCTKTFSRKDNLLQHQKTAHCPDKDAYSCPMCPRKMFSRKPNLRVHLKKCHSELASSRIQSIVKSAEKRTETKVRHGNPTCAKCYRSFTNDKHLKKHVATYHKVRHQSYVYFIAVVR